MLYSIASSWKWKFSLVSLVKLWKKRLWNLISASILDYGVGACKYYEIYFLHPNTHSFHVAVKVPMIGLLYEWYMSFLCFSAFIRVNLLFVCTCTSINSQKKNPIFIFCLRYCITESPSHTICNIQHQFSTIFNHIWKPRMFSFDKQLVINDQDHNMTIILVYSIRTLSSTHYHMYNHTL